MEPENSTEIDELESFENALQQLAHEMEVTE